jgi:dipeptidyl aminopeptidase/acylaminoacyl peptidase
LYGDEDTVVSIEQSEILIEVMMKIGVEAELHKLEGDGNRSQEFVQPEVQRKILAFLDRHLKHTCNSRKIESQNEGENNT